MMVSRQSKRPVAGLLILIFMFGACTRSHDNQARPVETAEEACRIATQHLSALGQDTSRSTEHIHPDYPISLDTLRHPGGAYVPALWNEDSPVMTAARARLAGRIFWACCSEIRRPSPGGGPNLVTDGIYAWVLVDARTGEVLLTLPQDYNKLTGGSH
jgi:hypothetical protein